MINGATTVQPQSHPAQPPQYPAQSQSQPPLSRKKYSKEETKLITECLSLRAVVSSPAVLKEKYIWQKLCNKLGLSDVAILDSGWPIRALPVTF